MLLDVKRILKWTHSVGEINYHYLFAKLPDKTRVKVPKDVLVNTTSICFTREGSSDGAKKNQTKKTQNKTISISLSRKTVLKFKRHDKLKR